MIKFGKGRVFEYVLDGSVLAFFIYYIHRLYSQLAQTYFWADETAHAYVSGLLLSTHSLHNVLPNQIHGELQWMYPPLFHVLSAIGMSVAGFSALKYLNLALLIVFLVCFYALIRKYYGRYEAGIACILLSLSSVIAVNTLRYMTELLSMVLFFFSFFFLLVALRKGDNKEKSEMIFAAASGLTTGLLFLTKQTGYVVTGFYFMLLLWFLVARKGSVKSMLTVLGVSAAVYAPYFIWASLYNDISVYSLVTFMPAGALKDPSIAASKRSFQVMNSQVKNVAWLFYKNNGVILCLSALMPLYHFIKTRARDFPHNYLFLLMIYLTATMMVWGITNPRHTITILPLMAFLAGYSVWRITGHRAIQAVVLMLLLGTSVYSTCSMPNYRLQYNAPPDFRYIADQIRKDIESGGSVMGNIPFDLIMYTGRPVIWPNYLQKKPAVELLERTDEAELYRALKSYNVRYIVVWKRFVWGDSFIWRNYPDYFMANCNVLIRQGKLSVKASSGDFVLLRVVG